MAGTDTREAAGEGLGGMPGRDVKALTGYVVEGGRDGVVTLARSAEGADCLEIAERDIVRRIDLPGDGTDLRRVTLHVDRGATVARRHRISISREAELFQGSLLAAYLARGSHDGVPGGPSRELAVQLYVAKSETTLTCWEDCTLQISACLTAS